MSDTMPLWWPVPELPPLPSDDELFELWVGFDHGCTLDEFREAYLNTRKR